jgi:hypothetical protein
MSRRTGQPATKGVEAAAAAAAQPPTLPALPASAQASTNKQEAILKQLVELLVRRGGMLAEIICNVIIEKVIVKFEFCKTKFFFFFLSILQKRFQATPLNYAFVSFKSNHLYPIGYDLNDPPYSLPLRYLNTHFFLHTRFHGNSAPRMVGR